MPTRLGVSNQWSWKYDTTCVRQKTVFLTLHVLKVGKLCVIFTFIVSKWHESRLEYIRWEYDFEKNVSTAVLYDVEYDTQRWRLPFVWCRLIQKGGCCIWPRGKQRHLLWRSVWLKEANTASLCEIEVYRETNTVVLYYMTLVMIQRSKLCCLVCCAEYETGQHCRLVLC